MISPSNLRQICCCTGLIVCLIQLLPPSYAESDSVLPKSNPASQAPPTVSVEAIDAALLKGAKFLASDQNANGSWGSATKTKGLNIYAPIPGAHHAFRTATTGLALLGLCEAKIDHPEIDQAIAKGEKWLIEELPRLRRADPTTTYNVWGHAYALRALVALTDHYNDQPEKIAQYRALATSQVERMIKEQELNGGWGYLDFDLTTKVPTGTPTSFTTATMLIAFHQAADKFDIPLPDKNIKIALRQILRQRTPDGAYVYSEGHRYRPRVPINRPGGSLSRAQVCAVALHYFERPEYATDELLDTWLQRLWDRNGWLDIARKRPVPHETWFANSGYFFFYGHHYAALAIELLSDPSRQSHHAKRLVEVLLSLQEENGCWWDYPLYDYHRPYGTGYSLSALAHARQILAN